MATAMVLTATRGPTATAPTATAAPATATATVITTRARPTSRSARPAITWGQTRVCAGRIERGSSPQKFAPPRSSRLPEIQVQFEVTHEFLLVEEELVVARQVV